ncbi:ABC transporter ATP-binding protein [Bradyrhizobium elkanii]|uniref:Branched-chain amino acid transport system ATP-binding protein n=1 Tax=Bradyrhizobium elkanii TaxID=29448 RepID=A0ABV4F7J6_BRAEL|nr:ABC transporter ATP-binding protein [Bradyrhizobium elkanii]MCA1396210.1 ABC transporter ATP-binding protein [Bradyrhizobium sp. BRP56]MCS3447233.1 branched-chain amino acid transport system ATP-binding protein [Bradyrhizobium elkanii]MCW2148529.1 branched-chain amino acid transport system ATP-binding protein [Bradyrhizobium elkanii]NWL69119.1 ATP-binding cassette domain-containing protein [Bradyrhizobium elkanii]WLB02294.1 ABC transporter ATP-binding protein [Bradyrhizobium elkanii]
MAKEPLLAVEGLNVGYAGSAALNDVSLAVQAEELICVIGANGAGKTSLIRTIAGIVCPTRGRIAWRGRDIVGMSPWEICELGIAQVAEGREVFPNLSVEDNLLIGGSLKRARGRRDANLRRVYELFPRLDERRRQSAGTLSGGEQQMLAIGRAMMSEPEMIMFDEPSIGLSPALTTVMFDVVKKLHSHRITILLVEQNVASSLAIGDRGYVLENGSIVLEGTGAGLLSNQDVRRAYLGL